MKQGLPAPKARGIATKLLIGLALLVVPALALPAAAQAFDAGSLQGREQGGPILLSTGSGFTRADGSKRVRALQRGLARLGFASGPADGLFGPRTEAAVTAFQQGHGLAVDGIAGPQTLGQLRRELAEREIPPLSQGSGYGQPNGAERVRALQSDLRAAGYRPGPVDGAFGPRTEAAVVAFQQDRRLTVDGVVGPETTDRLSAALPEKEFRQQRKVEPPRRPALPFDEGEPVADEPGLFGSLFGGFGSDPLVWWPLAVLGAMAFAVWVARRFLTAMYLPVENDHREKTSVVAAAFREDPDILASAVRSWLASGADEVVLLIPINEPYNIARADAAFGDLEQVRILETDDSAKRSSLEIGISVARYPIVVLTDSDTIWEPDLLPNLLMPFADRDVGGVGSRQRVIGVRSSIWRRAADWMLDWRYLAHVPAMAQRGAVACLSNRTVAYRRRILKRVLPGLVQETCRGKECVSGDDARLTWLVLDKGYRTTYQANAVAWTMMPATATGFFMQRLRWARDSYRCHLGAIARGWFSRQPAITRVSVLQGLLAPFSVVTGVAFATLAAIHGEIVALGLWLGWITCGRGIRVRDHLRQDPKQIVLLPFMTLVVLTVRTAVGFYALATMNKQEWITRSTEQRFPEGQASETLLEPLGEGPAIGVAEREDSRE